MLPVGLILPLTTHYSPNSLIHLMNHRLERLGIAFDGEDDGAFLDAVGGGGGGRDDLPAVGQAEAHGEGAVRAELDRLALERDFRARRGSAIDDQLRVELEPELALLALQD